MREFAIESPAYKQPRLSPTGEREILATLTSRPPCVLGTSSGVTSVQLGHHLCELCVSLGLLCVTQPPGVLMCDHQPRYVLVRHPRPWYVLAPCVLHVRHPRPRYVVRHHRSRESIPRQTAEHGEYSGP